MNENNLEEQVIEALREQKKEAYFAVVDQDGFTDRLYNYASKTITDVYNQLSAIEIDGKSIIDPMKGMMVRMLVETYAKEYLGDKDKVRKIAGKLAEKSYSNQETYDKIMDDLRESADKYTQENEEVGAKFFKGVEELFQEAFDEQRGLVDYLTAIAKEQGVQEATQNKAYQYDYLRSKFPTRMGYEAYHKEQADKLAGLFTGICEYFREDEDDKEVLKVVDQIEGIVETVIKDFPIRELTHAYRQKLIKDVYLPQEN